MNISICREGTEIGEWAEDEVRAFYAEGRLVPTDLYWREGMKEWAGLAGLIKPVPPFPEEPRPVAAQLPPAPTGPPPLPTPAVSAAAAPSKKRRDWKKELREFRSWIYGCIIFAAAFTGVKQAAPQIIDAILPAGAPSLHQQVLNLSQSINKMLPANIDNDTEVQGTSVDPDSTFHFRFVITKSSVAGTDPRALALVDRPAAFESYHTAADLKLLRDNKLSVSYDYYDSDGNFLFNEKVNADDTK